MCISTVFIRYHNLISVYFVALEKNNPNRLAFISMDGCRDEAILHVCVLSLVCCEGRRPRDDPPLFQTR